MARPLRYRHRAGLGTRIVDGEAFVITRNTIQHLSPVATLIWLAIAGGGTQKDVRLALGELYPAIPKRQLALDTGRTLRQLRRMGLARAS